MPRKTRNTRKKKEPSAPSDASKKKLAAIAEDNERESIDSLLEDFEIQTATLMKQALKQFDKEAKLMMSALPLKSSISKEILKMELSEFNRRGGSFKAVWESLKQEKSELLQSTEPRMKENTQSNPVPAIASEPVIEQNAFTTPATSTRSQRTRAKMAQATAKRKPRPLEEVKVQAFSNASGSPVDEKMLLQLHSDGLLVDIQEKIMAATTQFPQKWRSKLVQSFRQMKAQATLKDDVLVTPAVRR